MLRITRSNFVRFASIFMMLVILSLSLTACGGGSEAGITKDPTKNSLTPTANETEDSKEEDKKSEEAKKQDNTTPTSTSTVVPAPAPTPVLPIPGNLGDTTPPHVIDVSAQQGDINVNPSASFVLKFSESVKDAYCEVSMRLASYRSAPCKVEGNKIIIDNPYPDISLFAENFVFSPNSPVSVYVFAKDMSGNRVAYSTNFNTGDWKPMKAFDISKCSIPDTSIGLLPVLMLPDDCRVDDKPLHIKVSELDEKTAWTGSPITDALRQKIQSDNVHIAIKNPSSVTSGTTNTIGAAFSFFLPKFAADPRSVTNRFTLNNGKKIDTVFVHKGSVKTLNNDKTCSNLSMRASMIGDYHMDFYPIYVGSFGPNICY